MLRPSRSFDSMLLPLLIGPTVGAFAFVAKVAADGARFQWIGIPAMAVVGLVFGLVPYLLVAVPSCLAMEREEFHPTLKLLLLTIGGLGVGYILGHPKAWHSDAILVWAGVTGGATGLSLGFLRR